MEQAGANLLTKRYVKTISTVFCPFFVVLRRLLICWQKLLIYRRHMGFDTSVLHSFNGFLGRISFDLKHFRVSSLLWIYMSNRVTMVSLGLSESLLLIDQHLKLFFFRLSDLLYIINGYYARLSFDCNFITNFLPFFLWFDSLNFFIIIEAALPLGSLSFLRF